MRIMLPSWYIIVIAAIVIFNILLSLPNAFIVKRKCRHYIFKQKKSITTHLPKEEGLLQLNILIFQKNQKMKELLYLLKQWRTICSYRMNEVIARTNLLLKTEWRSGFKI